MGLLDGLMGKASAVDTDEVNAQLEDVLAGNETVASAYKLIRDMLIFTNKRVIFMDKQGVSGKKVNYLSIPYKSVIRFEVETAGTFDTDSELRIWMSGVAEPLELELKSNLAAPVQKSLADQLFN
ncbi:PH domain-containing protein [Alteromonas sp. 5E99-2]|uniref:PH domain-containing protein n=1 Tax=Alteromonas sp. 5E99-2 TaxID=2817683 RepID=UPI001A991F87|nr:PH domain-containing protein [Alteromonas sp. 5E99-2]MBO1254402.1 PH domain-containing protein [Alteromonas sp. 5E99-2]